jgi:hypothetical protein
MAALQTARERVMKALQKNTVLQSLRGDDPLDWDRETRNGLAEMLERCWKVPGKPGRPKDTLETNLRKENEKIRLRVLVWAKIKSGKSYDRALAQVAKDECGHVTGLKKAFPHFSFYIFQPIGNAPRRLHKTIRKARKELIDLLRVAAESPADSAALDEWVSGDGGIFEDPLTVIFTLCRR